jgi:S-adenosylmethionine-diacylgycerolhomoserine-N-methlytransferase
MFTNYIENDCRTAVEKYYRWQAPIYDLTRWTFLFGRALLLRTIASGITPGKILEVGCGTGRNLAEMARRFPAASITGLDLSADMLARAAKRKVLNPRRVRLLRMSYEEPLNETQSFDLVLLSYSLSMMNPGWAVALRAAIADLRPGGRLAVVDFANTPLGWFRQWMNRNHVRLDTHLIWALKRLCPSHLIQEHKAYGGAWKYFVFLGVKRAKPPLRVGVVRCGESCAEVAEQ